MLLDALMGTSSNAVIEVVTHHAPQMSFVENEQFVQPFSTYCSYPRFGVGIGPGRSIRGMDNLQLFGGENGIKRRCNLAVVIVSCTLIAYGFARVRWLGRNLSL
jgi:hypothetical protein